jgi:hypothetical protein
MAKARLKPKPSKQSQYGRFKQTARLLRSQETKRIFERAFENVASEGASTSLRISPKRK